MPSLRRGTFTVLVGLATAANVCAADEPTDVRPSVGFYRWQEDWSVLADPARRTEPGDDLKYISLSRDDPKRYVSLGITVRERYENNDAPQFGATGKTDLSYLLHRLELHMDAHLTDATRVFVQVENALALGLAKPGPADANKLDLRLAFIDSSLRIGDGIFKYRIGRQEIGFDQQRFVSARDGPNLRQAYDAVWADYERGDWRVSGFASQPVQYLNQSPFDDFSNRHLTYGGIRAQRRDVAGGELSATFSEYRNDNAHFLAGSGEEHRRNVDVHYAGAARGFDWDVESMEQQGSIGAKGVNAWAAGSLAGYTFSPTMWKPRLGLQLDAASGDRNLSDSHVGTFDPMFPNGYYETLSGYTGYTNFIHLKPSITLTPMQGVKVLTAVGLLWRQTTHDAVYVQPDIPVPGTAGEPGRRSSTYAELRIDWTVSRSLAFALEGEHYDVASAIRNAGGHDSDYIGIEGRWGW
jgi:hypothetical protein